MSPSSESRSLPSSVSLESRRASQSFDEAGVGSVADGGGAAWGACPAMLMVTLMLSVSSPSETVIVTEYRKSVS